MRFIYALGLFVGGLFILFGRSTSVDGLLGHGRGLFIDVLKIEYAALLLLVPAMTASALTVEKERETLPLLLLTRMSPSEIILQKYISRVVPILSYVLLSFPLMAVAYSYGGVTSADLIAACTTLLLAVLYSAAFSLLCSSYFRTTVEAVIAVYLGQVAVSWMTCGLAPLACGISGVDSFLAAIGSNRPGSVALLAIQVAFFVVLYLVLATEFLHRRAFVPPRNVLLEVFHALDRMFNEWNQVTGGVVLVHDGQPLPGDRPVAWRETAKRSLGTFRYLVRVLVVLEIPILIVSQMTNIEMIRGHSAMSWLWYTLCVTSAAMVCLHASNVIASERTRQTLAVLLATPLSGRELIIEKLSGVRRLLLVLSIPFATMIAFMHWFRDYNWDMSYVLQSTLACTIFGWGLTWLAFWIGMKTRSTLAAVFTSFGAAAALCAVPIALDAAARMTLNGLSENIAVAVCALNPATLLQMIEHIPAEEFRMQHGWSTLAYPYGFTLAMVGYSLFGWFMRSRCLKRADQLLGRAWREPDEASTEQEPPPAEIVGSRIVLLPEHAAG